MNGPFSLFKWEALFKDFSIFFEGFITTLEVSILGLMLALILGVIFGIFSTSKIKIFKIIKVN